MKKVNFLKLISLNESIIISKTNGIDTIAKAKDTFPSWIDPDFVKYGTSVKGQPTKEMSVQVFKMIRDGTLVQIFGSFGENLDRLCLSQDQIICFIKEHSKWLRTDGYGTFFLFKVGNEFFVARTSYRMHWSLGVDVFRLLHNDIICAAYGRRVVVPQL